MAKENSLTKMPLVTLSTVTPVYNGEAYLAELIEQLRSIRDYWESEGAPIALIESIFVDDGSIDSSSSVLQKLSEENDWVRVVTLSRNFGQHAATVAGICHTLSDWVVSLDEDLQHRPVLIPDLLKAAIDQKLDIVYGKPLEAAHGGSWRDLGSKVVKRSLAKITRLQQINMFSSFRLIRGSIARAAASSSSSQTYLDIALAWYTQSAGSIELEMRDERFINEKNSGYGFFALVRHFRRLIVSSELNITSIGFVLGASAILLAVLLGGNVLLTKIFDPASIPQAGWASLAAIICAFGGIIVALICIVMKYTNVLLLNQLGRPTFFTVDRSSDAVLQEWLSSDNERISKTE